MKPHQLNYLALLASEGSVRAVARAVGVSPASVTQGLRELERDTGISLFDRHGGRIRLSPAGQELLPHARQMDALQQHLQETIAHIKDAQSLQKLSVGITPWVAQTLLALVIPRFRQAMPHVQLEMFDGLSALAFPRLREGTLDICIARANAGEAIRGFDVQPLFRYELVVTARKGHPKAKATSLRELLDSDWIVNFGPGEQESFIANLFGRHQLVISPHNIHLAHSPALTMALVQQTDMLSVTPWPLVETMELRDKIIALQLREQLPTNTVGIIKRSQEALSPAARKFLEIFHDVVKLWETSQAVHLRRVLHAVETLVPQAPAQSASTFPESTRN